MKKWFNVEYYGVDSTGFEFSCDECIVLASNENEAIEYAKKHIGELEDATEIVRAYTADFIFEDAMFEEQREEYLKKEEDYPDMPDYEDSFDYHIKYGDC